MSFFALLLGPLGPLELLVPRIPQIPQIPWTLSSNLSLQLVIFQICNKIIMILVKVSCFYVSFLWVQSSWLDLLGDASKFFIMSTEFDKNISDWKYDCTDHKNRFDFFMRLVKWPKIAVKKCQNLIFKVNFQRQKSFESF